MESEQSVSNDAVNNSGSAQGFVASLAEKLGATARAQLSSVIRWSEMASRLFRWPKRGLTWFWLDAAFFA